MPTDANKSGKGFRLGSDSRNLLVAAQFDAEPAWEDLPDGWETRSSRYGRGILALPRQVRIAIILVITLALSYLMGIWLALYSSNELAPPASAIIPKQTQPAPLQLEESRAIAQRVARRFIETEDITERIELVRHPEIMEPLMRSFYQSDRPKAIGLSPLTSVYAAGQPFHRFHVRFPQGDRLLVIQAKDDEYKIDWEAFARHTPVPWETFLKGEGPKRATFRARIARTNYFNFRFSDQRRLLAYQIASPDLEAPIVGYVTKGSKAARQLTRFLRNTAENRVMLELAAPEQLEGCSDHQVEILRFIQPGWIQAELR